MICRTALTIALSIALCYIAALLASPSGGPLGKNAVIGIIAGLAVSPVTAFGLRNKPLGKSVLMWLVPSAAVLFALAPLAPLWVTLSVGCLASVIACGILYVEVEDIGAQRPNRCERCSYDLSGNETGTCPECGTAWRGPAEPPDPAAPD